jgi:alkanesulfonate monooxygenase SsuD/methylene tetrahydromethanopterin reductase-like flavin-dependent oxidoreductase (luciferase family)
MSARPADDPRIYADYADYVVEAEALGFHSAFLVEHHFTGLGQVSQSLALLAFLAPQTATIRLGTAVVVVPWHNPVLLGELAATVDVLSGGRLDLGVGRGYRFSEYRGFCLPPEELSARFDEAMHIIRRAWANGERFSHHGQYWHFEDIVLEPAPVQQPYPPLWLAAASSETIRKAAEDGYKLLLDQVASFELVAERVALYRETLEARGASFAPTDVICARTLHFARNAQEREEQIARRAAVFDALNELSLSPAARAGAVDITTRLSPPHASDPRRSAEQAAIIGSPDECIDRLKRLEAAGVGQVILAAFDNHSRETLRLFAREVMPAFTS